MNENLFTKEFLKNVLRTTDEAVFTLIYDGNDTEAQIAAGKELRQAKWILASIIDHVYDYYPMSYFMNDDEKEEYPEYKEWFLSHPTVGIQNAIKYVKNNFAILETVTRDELNQHRIPVRNIEKEAELITVLEEVAKNLDFFVNKLNGQKKVTDSTKPTEIEIRGLINVIDKIIKSIWDCVENSEDINLSARAVEFDQLLEMYKMPLYMAWQVYNYGWHSDFWKEGDSMLGYMMFEGRAKEIIPELIKTLEEESPFANFEQSSMITNGLLKVYRHLLTQDLYDL